MTEVLINNEWIVVDDLSLKKQISEFGTFSTKTNITNQIAIFKTKETRKTFEWLDDIQSNSILPYSILDSKLRIDNNILINKGEALIERTNDLFFEIILRDGNIDFFKAIEGKVLRDLDLSAYDFIWDLNYFKNNRTANDIPIFMHYSFGLGALDVAHMLPFIPLSLIVDKIIEESGYKKEGTFFADELYTQILISLVDRLPDSNTQQNLIAKAENAVSWTLNLSDPYNRYVEFTDDNSPFITESFALGNRTRYNAFYEGSYSFNIFVEINTNSTVFEDRIFVYYGSFVDTIFFPSGSGLKSISKTYLGKTLEENESIYISVQRNPNNIITLINAYIDVTNVPDVKFGVYGTEFNISYNLPELLQSDLITMVLKLFAARIDTIGNTVHFRSYADLKTKIQQGDFIDWSDKDFSKVTVKYKSNYAKNNKIVYNNTDVNGGVFQINDKQLEKLKILYKLPLNDNESLKAFKKTEDSEGNFSFEFSRLNNAIMKKRVFRNGTFTIYNGSNLSETETIVDNLPIATSINLQEYIDKYYDFFEQTLNMYREITANVYLNINDINMIDFSKPYFIKEWGWFMLEPLKFKKGEKTRIKLIHINKSSFVPNLLGDFSNIDFDSRDFFTK